MRSIHYWTYSFIVPALVGVIVALAILLWAPHWLPNNKANAVLPPNNEPAYVSPQLKVSYADAVDATAPAVVNIYTRTLVQRKLHPIFDDSLFQRFFSRPAEPSERILSSLGSGVIMSAEGFVLTNNHVIHGADEIVVALYDGREANATVIGSDPESDLALLRIDLDNLPFIKVSESELRVGDVVLAIGNPFGVGQTVTIGIVSATGRNRLGLSEYEDYIQTDAAINPGNSGGALVNAYGELVGLNTAIFSKSGGSQGIGFAIPSNIVQRALQDLSIHGSAIRGWLGIEVQESTPALLESLRLPKALTGLIVMGIHPQGPAAKAGLHIGDIIVQINEDDAGNARRAMNQIAAVRPGETVKLHYLRNGQRLQTQAIAGTRKTNSAR